MSAPTPPPSCKDFTVERELSAAIDASDSPSSGQEIGSSTQVMTPISNELGTKIAEPRSASYDAPTTPEPCSAIKNADIEMTDEWSHHDSSMKQKDRTPSDSSQGDAYNAAPVLVKFEEVEIKTEVEPQMKAEFDPEAGRPKISDITEPAQKQNENEGGAKTPKQPRRTPAKTAFEYHKRKQEDSIGGIRKVRKTVRNVDPEKLLHSISHQDPVTAYNAGPGNGAAPVMAVSTKKAFFQEILSSCKDKDAFQKFKTDVNILDEESRSFGFKRMQMKNGMWQLKGMKSRKLFWIVLSIWKQPGLNFSCLSLPDERRCLDGKMRMFCRRPFGGNSC
jgi:hypothetical protein